MESTATHNNDKYASRRGRKRTLEARRKMSEASKGKKKSAEHARKVGEAHRGKKLSEEHKRKIGENRGRYWLGKKRSLITIQKIKEARAKQVITEEHKRKIGEAGRGKKRSEETKRRMSEARKGKKNPNWKGGVQRGRHNGNWRYSKWRTAVYNRDDYTCQICRVRSGLGYKVILNADHIKPWALFPKLRYKLSNGRALCVPCHKKTDTYGGKKGKIGDK